MTVSAQVNHVPFPISSTYLYFNTTRISMVILWQKKLLYVFVLTDRFLLRILQVFLGQINLID